MTEARVQSITHSTVGLYPDLSLIQNEDGNTRETMTSPLDNQVSSLKVILKLL